MHVYMSTASPFFLGRQSWLAGFLLQDGGVGREIAAEPSAKGLGMAALIEPLRSSRQRFQLVRPRSRELGGWNRVAVAAIRRTSPRSTVAGWAARVRMPGLAI